VNISEMGKEDRHQCHKKTNRARGNIPDDRDPDRGSSADFAESRPGVRSIHSTLTPWSHSESAGLAGTVLQNCDILIYNITRP
jgi:hypothetical protein